MLGSGSNTNIVYVQGEAGAKAYPVINGYTMMLMDSEDTKFYIKTADAVGIPKLRVFKFEEVFEEPQESKQYITKDDLESFKSEIREMLLASLQKEGEEDA